MLCLDQLENVSEKERSSELYIWAKLFVASTWEEIQVLAQNSDIIKSTAATIYQLSAEENIRLQCEARERYEHDKASLLHLGEKRGRELGEKIGNEQINQLAQLLHLDGRMDDFIRSTIDPEFQQKLLREYQLLADEKK